MTSDRYAVEYSFGAASSPPLGWTGAKVYVSYYGATNASPYHSYSGYPSPYGNPSAPRYLESMSFVSIPASANTAISLRVTKLWGAAFPAIERISVRPGEKGVKVVRIDGYTLELSATTAQSFLGDQFVLWWDGAEPDNSTVEGLSIFLDPPYTRPTGPNVKVIARSSDLAGDLSSYDTLDIEGVIAVAFSGPQPAGAQTFSVPANIANVFLGPGSWLQGKLRFEQSGTGRLRTLYGPGVIDASRFSYRNRLCGSSSQSDQREYGYESVSWSALPSSPHRPALPDRFVVDGIVITDSNYYATHLFENSALNNVKVLTWNESNDGLALGVNTSASNVFVRAGDDSLKMWGAYTNVINATVWQNFNGGVVNLGRCDNSPGDGGVIDGLYVVKTDWVDPTTGTANTAAPVGDLGNQNDAIIDSMMLAGTRYGTLMPPIYRNIYVTDPPLVLFSLKILPQLSGPSGSANCPTVPTDQPAVLNLNVEGVVSPPSQLANSIGFESLATPELPGARFNFGDMNIALNEVSIVSSNGTATTLTGANASSVGKIATSGSVVNIDYGSLYRPNRQWFSAWAAAPEIDIYQNGLAGTTVRMIVRPTIAGTSVRVRVENTVGQFPVEFSAAYIGRVQSGATLVAGSNIPLTFDGKPGLSLAAGAAAYSDPVAFPVSAFALYAISLEVKSASDIAAHRVGLVTNYVGPGDLAANASAAGFTAVPPLGGPLTGGLFPVYWISALDVQSATSTGTVVAFGDSITDGSCSTGNAAGVAMPDEYNRWTDVLAIRFAALPPQLRKAVVNEGIAGNKVVAPESDGPQALVRMNNDVLSREGVTHVILFEGSNDLGTGIGAAQVIAADEQLIDRAHAAGLAIIGATVIPRGGSPKWTASMEVQRLALNEWIRHQANFDGVIDFDALMQGPVNPQNGSVTLPANWSCGDGDGVHPNAAGYAAMGAYIDLSLFSTANTSQ